MALLERRPRRLAESSGEGGSGEDRASRRAIGHFNAAWHQNTPARFLKYSKAHPVCKGCSPPTEEGESWWRRRRRGGVIGGGGC